jgi:hypothetical protein
MGGTRSTCRADQKRIQDLRLCQITLRGDHLGNQSPLDKGLLRFQIRSGPSEE